MAIEKVYLDPNAQSYTDDEIVGKVNTATANITRASSVEATARPIEAGEVGNDEIEAAAGIEKSKLAALEIADADVAAAAAIAKSKLAALEIEDADVKAAAAISADKLADGSTIKVTANGIRDNIVAIADDDREILISRPTTGQKKIYAIQTHSDGKQEVEQSDTAES